MLIDEIIMNSNKYSTKDLNIMLFDFDEVMLRNKFYIERYEHKFKTGKYHHMNFFMMTIAYPNKIPWIIENFIKDNNHKLFLEFCMKRHQLNRIILRRMDNNQFKAIEN